MDFNIQEIADKEICPKEKKKEYKKMMHKYKKQLCKDAKDMFPWEYGGGVSMFYNFLCYMRDYYKLNYNVWGEERDDVPMSRLESLEAAIREIDLYYDENDEVQNKYYVRSDVKIDTAEKFWKLPLNEMFIPVEPYKNMQEAIEAENKEKEEHYNKAFEIIKENLRYWWD